MRRLLPLVTGLAVAALVATGCSSGPSVPAATGSAAAVVGGVVVPATLVQERVRTSVPDLRAAAAEANAQPGAAPVAVDAERLATRARTLLTQAILHEVIDEQARRDGIVVPPDAVDARLAQVGGPAALAQGSGYDAATVRELVADQLTVAEIGRRQFDRLEVRVDYATVDDRAAADALAARIAADPAGPVVASLPPDRAAAGLSLRPGTARGSRTAATSVLFGLPADTVTISSAAAGATSPGTDAPDPATQPWIVVHVLRRALDAAGPGPGVVPAAQVDTQTMIQFGLRAIQPTAREVGVSVNPRYGTWDPTQLQVVAPPAAAGTIIPVAPVPPPATASAPLAPAP